MIIGIPASRRLQILEIEILSFQDIQYQPLRPLTSNP